MKGRFKEAWKPSNGENIQFEKFIQRTKRVRNEKQEANIAANLSKAPYKKIKVIKIKPPKASNSRNWNLDIKDPASNRVNFSRSSMNNLNNITISNEVGSEEGDEPVYYEGGEEEDENNTLTQAQQTFVALFNTSSVAQSRQTQTRELIASRRESQQPFYIPSYQ